MLIEGGKANRTGQTDHKIQRIECLAATRGRMGRHKLNVTRTDPCVQPIMFFFPL